MTDQPSAPPITKGIVKLARQIDASNQTEFVPVQPEGNCQPGRCFDNVDAIVRQFGGSTQHGWSMRERPSVFVEAEFHAVWRRPDGALIDVTPRTDGAAGILFLPDSRAVWEGEDVEPRRMQLHEQPCYCGSQMPFKICHGLADD